MWKRSLILTVLLFTSCFTTQLLQAKEIVIGSGKIKRETRTVANFKNIIIQGSGKLQITQSNKEGLKIQADDNILPLITNRVKGDVLYLGTKNKKADFNTKKPVEYFLTVKNIQNIQTSGSINITTSNLKSETINLKIDGSGNADIKLNVKKFTANINGTGFIKAQGNADEQEIAIDGTGEFLAKKLMTIATKVVIQGFGKAEVNSKDVLEVEISGSGIVKYYGRPRIIQTLSGGGEIIPVN